MENNYKKRYFGIWEKQYNAEIKKILEGKILTEKIKDSLNKQIDELFPNSYIKLTQKQKTEVKKAIIEATDAFVKKEIIKIKKMKNILYIDWQI